MNIMFGQLLGVTLHVSYHITLNVKCFGTIGPSTFVWSVTSVDEVMGFQSGRS